MAPNMKTPTTAIAMSVTGIPAQNAAILIFLFFFFRSAPSGFDRYNAGLFQGAHNAADHDGVAPRRKRQQLACHPPAAAVFIDKDQAVNRDGALCTDMHSFHLQTV